MRDNELDALIEQVEQMVGMGHAAWDTINPRKIAAAFCKALAAPAETPDEARQDGYELGLMARGGQPAGAVGEAPKGGAVDEADRLAALNAAAMIDVLRPYDAADKDAASIRRLAALATGEQP